MALLTSNFEAFPLFCIEALSCGKIFLSTPCAGPKEIMEGLNYNFISSDFSSENIAELIEKNYQLAEDAKVSQDLKTFAKKYSIEKCAESYYQLFLKSIK